MRKDFCNLGIAAAVALVGLAFGSGCAIFGGGSDRLPKAKGYELTVPGTWVKTKSAESDHAFRLPSGSLVTVNSSCTRNSDAPLEVLTKHLLFGSRNVVVEKRERISVAGHNGLYTVVRATLEGVPFNLELFVLPRRGCVFDFSLVSPKTISSEESKGFLAFIQSFNYGTR